MKVLVAFLATLFVASAVPLGQKKILFNEDGALTIYDGPARYITFPVPTGLASPSLYDIVVDSQYIPAKSIVLDVQYQKYGPVYNQIQLICKYFLPYQGQVISDEIYGQILYQIKQYVVQGQISPVIYATLKSLLYQPLFDQLVAGEGVFAREGKILGVPVTGELVNEVYQKKLSGYGSYLYGQGYYGYPYGGQYGYPYYGQGFGYPYGAQYGYQYGGQYGQGLYSYLYGKGGYGYGSQYPYYLGQY